TVTDSNGCSAKDTVVIKEPSAITASVVGTDGTCGNNNGSATVTASGGTGTLTYSWSPSGGTNATATSLAAGTYTCTITDSNSCLDFVTVTINNAGAPSITSIAPVTQPKCNGGTGTATANVSGGASPYTYSWSPSGGTNATANNLSAGTYTCTVKDKNGCTTIDSVTINNPPAIS